MRDLVSREIAISLKKLGFDEPCFAYYDKEGLKVEKYFFNEQNLNSIFNKWQDKGEIKTSAPTLSQAFRFFRKKGWYYDICKTEDGWEYYIQSLTHSWLSDPFDDDDTCELECLNRIVELEIIRSAVEKEEKRLSEEEKINQLKLIFKELKDQKHDS
jgi:hypothetical protein